MQAKVFINLLYVVGRDGRGEKYSENWTREKFYGF
jgi:hypothetical protein